MAAQADASCWANDVADVFGSMRMFAGGGPTLLGVLKFVPADFQV
jgi:hypothetical protein